MSEIRVLVSETCCCSPLIIMTKIHFISCSTTDDCEPNCKDMVAFLAEFRTELGGSNSFFFTQRVHANYNCYAFDNYGRRPFPPHDQMFCARNAPCCV